VTQTEPTLTLRDIADLAGVQRPVVSMWRRRTRVRGETVSFPKALPGAGAVERFSRAEVVEWLALTGRGNNPAHRLDAPALSAPVGVSLEDLVTLLCLHAHGDSDLADLTATEREELARRSDPHDEFLLAEVRQLSATDEVMRFVDELVEASFGLPEALTRLEKGPAGRALGQRALMSEALELVTAVVRAGMLFLDPEGVPVSCTGEPPSLALAVASVSRALVIRGSGPAERALRRRAYLYEVDVVDQVVGPMVRVQSVLNLETDAALERVDEFVLDLERGNLGVLIGSAGTLCERLRGEHERNRASTLRMRRLAAALRLPRGMWRDAHRQALALWVCGGGLTVERPMVADLGAETPSEVSLGDVAADVSGALSAGGGRAFRYLRAVDIGSVLTGAPLVPPGARALQLGTPPSGHLDRVRAAALRTAEPETPFDVLVTEAPGRILLRQRSLGELRDAKTLTMLRGSRIDLTHAISSGSIAVLSADGTTDGMMLDPFDAARRYPRAYRTEAGDVVFVDGSEPAARVDEHGGSLVASPSRILRLRQDAGIGPNTLAALINHQARRGEWQSWNVPLLDASAAAALEQALTEAVRYGSSLRRRQEAVHDLINALIDGVAAGAVNVVQPSKT
jgi:predicted DNA-binding transcriptional regulator AlpA